MNHYIYVFVANALGVRCEGEGEGEEAVRTIESTFLKTIVSVSHLELATVWYFGLLIIHNADNVMICNPS